MGENHALAPLPQRTLDGWHRFVASGDRDLLASLLSEHIVFRSPFVQSPIPGRPATLLVLTRVVQIFENFRYHRTFIAGSPTMQPSNLPPISANGSTRASISSNSIRPAKWSNSRS